MHFIVLLHNISVSKPQLEFGCVLAAVVNSVAGASLRNLGRNLCVLLLTAQPVAPIAIGKYKCGRKNDTQKKLGHYPRS
jgi:hypothetical protein